MSKSKKGKRKMAECKQGTQENNKENKVKDQPDTNKGGEQAQGSTSVGRETDEVSAGTVSPSGETTTNGKPDQKSKASASSQGNEEGKPSWQEAFLVSFSLLFILTIVVGLFADTFSGFSVTVGDVGNFKGSTITLTSVLLFILSIFISILSGYIVHKKDEEKKQKQRKMVDEIEKALKELYEKGE